MRVSFFISSHRRCSTEKGVLKILPKSQENNCASVSFLIKLQASGLRFFPVNFSKFLRSPFLQNIFGRLLLFFYKICQFLTEHVGIIKNNRNTLKVKNLYIYISQFFRDQFFYVISFYIYIYIYIYIQIDRQLDRQIYIYIYEI